MDGDVPAQLPELAIALAIGLLIGIQRGWVQRDAVAGRRVAGVRTYGLLCLSGGLLVPVSLVQPAFAIVASVALCSLIALGYLRTSVDPDGRSVTDAVASVATLFLGALAVGGETRIAVIAAGVIIVLLAARNPLHSWLRSLDDTEIRASAQFVLVALVVWPLLPDRGLGPYDALNPREIWLVVIFVMGVSFAGYWAGKRYGTTRGTLLAAAIGATYSSTAVTAELSRRLRSTEGNAPVLCAGIAAATAIMLARVLILCAILAPLSFLTFARIVAPAAIVAAAIALWSSRKVIDDHQTALPTANPFALGPAIGFAVLVAIIILVSKWAIARFGNSGLTVLLGLTGLYDVDSAIIIVSNLSPTGGVQAQVATGLALAILVNTVLKSAVVIVLAGPGRGKKAVRPLAVSAAILAAGFVFAL